MATALFTGTKVDLRLSPPRRYIRGNKECGIVYFWQGTQSSKDECMAAALHSVKIDEQRFKGEATQVRVQMGKVRARRELNEPFASCSAKWSLLWYLA